MSRIGCIGPDRKPRTTVLAVVGGTTYDYDLVRRLREAGLDEVGQASVYGTLRRLFHSGHLTSGSSLPTKAQPVATAAAPGPTGCSLDLRSERRSRSARGREPQMSLLLLDTTFLIDVERSSGDLDDAIDDDVGIAAITVAEPLVVKLASIKRQKGARGLRRRDHRVVQIIADIRNVAVGHADLLVAVRGQGGDEASRPARSCDPPERATGCRDR